MAHKNRTNVALPFSKLTVEQPVKMTAGGWISLTGLVVSAIGFSVVIWQLVRTANAPDGARPGGRLTGTDS